MGLDSGRFVEDFWRHFYRIMQLPRGSGREDPVREYVNGVAVGLDDVQVKWYKKDAVDPGGRVVVLKKHPAKASRFILQSHLDMVCTPSGMRFPLTPDETGFPGWIGARDADGRKSTLGADDGFGVAAALALLESGHEAGFECLFTVEEETTMRGASSFDPALLEARTLLNLDGGEVDAITYGCAGGVEINFDLPVAGEEVPPGASCVELKVSGLLGGHSATCINAGRLNAIKVLAQCLNRLGAKHAFNIAGFSGGNAKNAIPSEAVCTVVLRRQDAGGLTGDFEARCIELQEHYRGNEPHFTYAARVVDSPLSMLDAASTRRALALISAIPHGAIKMDPVAPSVVMTSNNLGLAGMDDGYVRMRSFHRSSSRAELDRVTEELMAVGRCHCCETTRENLFPPWIPNTASPLLILAKDVYGGGAKIEVTHGGLECGFIYQKYAGAMDCVSIGPTIEDGHASNERMHKESVKTFLDRLSRIVERL